MLSVLAVDLDDTLVRSDQTVSPRTLELVAAWLDAGRRAVIATGRPPRATRAIPAELHALPWICYNGGVILHAGETLHSANMTAADTASFVNDFVDVAPDAWIGIEVDDTFYLSRNGPPYAETILVDDIRSVAHQPASKIITALDAYRQVASRLAPLPGGMKPQASAKYNLLQMMSTGVSKASALRLLVEQWGLDMAHVVAFGDDSNDMEMIQAAGVGVAMANAIPELKAVANRVTLSNDEDGVAIVVAELLAA